MGVNKKMIGSGSFRIGKRIKKLICYGITLAAFLLPGDMAFNYDNEMQNKEQITEIQTTSPTSAKTNDRLAEIVNNYIFNETINDTTADDELENLIQIQISGEPTKEDIEDMLTFLKDPNNQKRSPVQYITELGIKNIVILPEKYKEEVDYIGLAQCTENNGEIRVFSRNIIKNGIFYHELTHCYTAWKRRTDPNYVIKEAEFASIAGPYNQIITEEKKDIITAKAYTDICTDGPRHGYLRPYGGRDIDEDIAVYGAEIITDPSIIANISESYDIYEGKLRILKDIGIILDYELEITIAIIDDKIKTEPKEIAGNTTNTQFMLLKYDSLSIFER